MVSEDYLVREFLEVIERFYPQLSQLLKQCHVKVLDGFVRRIHRRYHYVVIYCVEEVLEELQIQKSYLKDIAENMGITEVVLINANQIVRDPMSKVRRDDWRLWLELHWLISTAH